MKQFWEGLMEWKTAASLMFTGCVILCAVIVLFLGESVISISVLAALLIVCALGTFLQFFAFTDRIIKKMRYTVRMIVFAIPFFALITATAFFFRWFTPDTANWLMFAGVILIVFIGMTVGFEIYYRAMGKKYDGLLGQYRKQRQSQAERLSE